MYEFYKVLFREGEKICLSKDCYGTQLLDLEDCELVSRCYFAINPLKEKRCDANVTAHRNILIEMDKITLQEQAAHIIDIGMPWTTCVYSGNKSFHYIISLAEDVDEKKWRNIVQRCYGAVGREKVDTSCGNPSRFSRCPEQLHKNGRPQILMKIREPVKNDDLEKWLCGRGFPPVSRPTPIKLKVDVDKTSPAWFTDIFLRQATREFLEKGAESGEKNKKLLQAAFDFRDAGKPLEEAFNRLLPISDNCGYPHKKAVYIINYCYSKQ